MPRVVERTERGLWLTLGYFHVSLTWFKGNWYLGIGWSDPTGGYDETDPR